MERDPLTGVIVDEAYRIHASVGPGLLESVYSVLLERALQRRGLAVERNKPIALDLNGVHLDNAFRVDLLVENRVVVELKSIETLNPVHWKQVLTYLRLLDLPVGLLINFGAPTLREGLRRVVNSHRSASLDLRGSA